MAELKFFRRHIDEHGGPIYRDRTDGAGQGGLRRLHDAGQPDPALEQDLSDLDFSQFKPVSFEFAAKAAQINMRVPQPLLDAVKVRARARGVPYTRYIRELIERDVRQPPTKDAP